MARKGREISSLGIYHIILRGKDELFFGKKDYEEFLAMLKKYFSDENQIYSYSLDKKKIHLVVFAENGVSAVLKPLCTSYARYVNRTYGKTGKLFYDRFMSIPIENEEMLALAVRYTAKMPSHITSLSEYKKKSEICNVDGLSERIPIKSITSSGSVFPSDDDYASMSDEELKQLILTLFGGNISDNDRFSDYLTKAVSFSNLSMARLARIFEIKPIYKKGSQIKKKKAKTAPEKTSSEELGQPKKEPIRKKQELSVWLL